MFLFFKVCRRNLKFQVESYHTNAKKSDDVGSFGCLEPIVLINLFHGGFTHEFRF